jgi:hypothetical protein
MLFSVVDCCNVVTTTTTTTTTMVAKQQQQQQQSWFDTNDSFLLSLFIFCSAGSCFCFCDD